ncbi:hypothetical protein GCM10025868_26010 [Angustibacter aerolatus]|uniref:RNA polymerase sigma factor 70 region 4 type 2 domain-containing protein n=1 Tax=Angustibacter aerolatus TaxID=1162965 RepID=A0ABQ6JKN0_9ACTN|nr:sigma factor-like helix-turn-helix DNA-binding protein [Angustibacter aerolatus]GMA87351.1 hypothetical protein GCM10025868_26010 [Angustibacter aerolatus]
MLRYLDDLTEQQTAAALGVTVGTVKSQASKALRRLRVEPGPPPTGDRGALEQGTTAWRAEAPTRRQADRLEEPAMTRTTTDLHRALDAAAQTPHPSVTTEQRLAGVHQRVRRDTRRRRAGGALGLATGAGALVLAVTTLGGIDDRPQPGPRPDGVASAPDRVVPPPAPTPAPDDPEPVDAAPARDRARPVRAGRPARERSVALVDRTAAGRHERRGRGA